MVMFLLGVLLHKHYWKLNVNRSGTIFNNISGPHSHHRSLSQACAVSHKSTVVLHFLPSIQHLIPTRLDPVLKVSVLNTISRQNIAQQAISLHWHHQVSLKPDSISLLKTARRVVLIQWTPLHYPSHQLGHTSHLKIQAPYRLAGQPNPTAAIYWLSTIPPQPPPKRT